ncbi:MAG: shikimate dehydrogenase [Deltaproteobacteria bacterium]|nr:shikimate dehydrogenase [Deltaproteobacteria bacterium]
MNSHPNSDTDRVQPTDAESEIETQRQLIDRLDGEILRLLNDRLSAAARIGAIKQRVDLGVLDGGREVHVYQRLLSLNREGILPSRFLLRIYADLICASREIQQIRPSVGGDGEPPARFAVFGNPVGHSLSPIMHTAAFAATAFNGVYVAVPVQDIRPAVAGLRALGFRGASITLPHKESVMACLDEVEDTARRIKAVNTIVNAGGRLQGYNTDFSGAIRALKDKTSLAGRAVAILGAGGAARAVAFGILAEGGRVTVFNRAAERGRKLADELQVEFRPLSEFKADSCEIMVNTTSVGMAPRGDDTPVAAEKLRPGLVVMDIVYNPLKTRLLREAVGAGCTIIDGLSMFVHQGARQFELWTGMKAPVDIMRMAVEAELAAL